MMVQNEVTFYGRKKHLKIFRKYSSVSCSTRIFRFRLAVWWMFAQNLKCSKNEHQCQTKIELQKRIEERETLEEREREKGKFLFVTLVLSAVYCSVVVCDVAWSCDHHQMIKAIIETLRELNLVFGGLLKVLWILARNLHRIHNTFQKCDYKKGVQLKSFKFHWMLCTLHTAHTDTHTYIHRAPFEAEWMAYE